MATITAGTIADARPWANGVESATSLPGVVVETYDEWATLWFPKLGGFTYAEDGRSVQAIYLSKLQRPRPLAGGSLAVHGQLAKRVRAGDHYLRDRLLVTIGAALQPAITRDRQRAGWDIEGGEQL